MSNDGCDNKGTCGEHSGLMEHIGSIKGQLSILLKLVAVLVTGMAYAIIQNHSVDKQLVSMEIKQAATENSIKNLGLSTDYIYSMDRRITAIEAFCCEDDTVQ